MYLATINGAFPVTVHAIDARDAIVVLGGVIMAVNPCDLHLSRDAAEEASTILRDEAYAKHGD
jgi:hypothetical protein